MRSVHAWLLSWSNWGCAFPPLDSGLLCDFSLRTGYVCSHITRSVCQALVSSSAYPCLLTGWVRAVNARDPRDCTPVLWRTSCLFPFRFGFIDMFHHLLRFLLGDLYSPLSLACCSQDAQSVADLVLGDRVCGVITLGRSFCA